MKKTVAILSLMLALAPALKAQKIDVSLLGRGSISASRQESGFKGDYLQLVVSGTIDDHFSYAFRQRLNRPITREDFFNATDWLYLTYSTGKWEFSAGKQIVQGGGIEYDKAPIDVYYFSEASSNFACYQFGASVSRYIGTEKLTFQVTRSPFGDNGRTLSDRFAYNLSLRGSTGDWFQRVYSVNFFETGKGLFTSYFALGNIFTFNPVTLELDLYHRSDCLNPSFFKDYTLAGRVTVSAAEWLDLFAKATYDRNSTKSQTTVAIGTDICKYAFGAEFYPKKGSRDIRLHCLFYHDTHNTILAGLTMKLRLFSK